MWLLLPFIAVPLIEIALFIQVGGAIGMWWTLSIVLATALLGSYLVRSEGAKELANLRKSLNDLSDPTQPLAYGAMILFSGALLLTPGFFTDVIGFALLVPQVRAFVLRQLKSRVNVARFQMGPDREPDRGPDPQGPQPRPRQPNDRVIDGEFEDVTPGKQPTHQPSEWTKH
jgi:UPF0716 protein FxsA